MWKKQPADYIHNQDRGKKKNLLRVTLLHIHALINCCNWRKEWRGNQEWICCAEYAHLKNNNNVSKIYLAEILTNPNTLLLHSAYSDRVTPDRTEELCVKDKITLQQLFVKMSRTIFLFISFFTLVYSYTQKNKQIGTETSRSFSLEGKYIYSYMVLWQEGRYVWVSQVS